MTREDKVDRAIAGATYWLVIVVLAALAIGCMAVVASTGLSGIGLAALAGALVCVAVLLSYAGSMRDRRRTPAP